MTNRTDTNSKPSFALLDHDDLAGEQTADVVSTTPTPSPQPAPQAAPQARPASAMRSVREAPAMNNAAPQDYMQPELGGIRPLAERALAELDVRAAGTKLASDAKPAQPGVLGVSKVKLALTGACLVAAIAIGATMFGHSPAPTSAPVATNLAAPAPAAAPTATAPALTTQAGGQTVTPVGIDVGNTSAIALDTGGDIDMIEQWTPVTPVEQSCTAGALSPYLQKVCGKVGKERYFSCAPDGFHWDPRLPGCGQF